MENVKSKQTNKLKLLIAQKRNNEWISPLTEMKVKYETKSDRIKIQFKLNVEYEISYKIKKKAKNENSPERQMTWESKEKNGFKTFRRNKNKENQKRNQTRRRKNIIIPWHQS